MKLSTVLFSALSAVIVSTALVSAPASAADGKKVFNKCKACHAVEAGKQKVGPSLAGIYGKQAGTVEGFKRYKGLKEADWAWNTETLDAYLTDPRKYTKEKTGKAGSMVLKLRKAEERAAVIEYLKTL